MKTMNAIAVISALVQAAYAQSSVPIINTPAAIIQCQPALLTFSGGRAPYFIAALPAGQVSAAPILSLPQQAAAGSYTWIVNLPAGTNITLRITDGSGAPNYAAPLVVQASGDNSCLGTTASSAATSGVSTTVTAGPTTISVATSTGPSASTTLISSAPSATVTASGGPITTNITQANGTTVAGSSGYNFTCAPGQGSLTYGITTAVLQGVSLRQAASYFGNWIAAAPGNLVRSSGTGVGAQRTYTYNGNITLSETLRLNQTNASTGALYQQWNFTTAGAVPVTNFVTVYNAYDDLTVYTNGTTNATTVQYFVLACFNNQQLGLPVLAQYISTSVTRWATQLTTPNASTVAPLVAVKARRSVQLF